MSRYICIHGHFYQPPRENPWTGKIEVQPSAKPYRDWNERVCAECYQPNLNSKIFGEKGKEESTFNNYSVMSFNFGPTLLSWMEVNEPGIYRGILDSDRQSQEHFSGHGSAIAQCYNHMIMPLANSNDKRTQVYWGIKDFEHRFKRFPEGMWLPETAVDLETLDVLAEFGIKYTVLAPHQAKRIRHIGSGSWHEVDQHKLDPHRGYLCRLPSGRTITLFFYDGDISHEIAFGDLLKNGEVFAKHLIQKFHHKKTGMRLVHVATDGETYGHHKKFGELALTYCLDVIQKEGAAKLTVYGEYLEKHPPELEAEIHENSSWSCVHGVERWRSDCGCKIDAHEDSQQKWRTHLRAALDLVRDKMIFIYETEMKRMDINPQKARDEYIRVILDGRDESVQDFFDEVLEADLSPQEETFATKLLEMQKFALLMYTSCGWFFDDIAGIEAVQVLQYAARALELFQEITGDSLEEEFLKILQSAPVNNPEYKDGAEVYTKLVKITNNQETSYKKIQ